MPPQRLILIFWLVGTVLVVVFNGPILARMLRREAQPGETPEDVQQRRRRGTVLLVNTILGLVGGLALILFVFPIVLGE